MKTVRALHLKSVLRSADYFSEALDASVRYLRHEEDDDDDVIPARDRDHSRSHLIMSVKRMDAVGMCLQRRMFHGEMAADKIIGISVFTDASPVTNAEVQGMLVDFLFKDGESRTLHLPGASLSYGHAGILSKTMAFVWAVWLIAGPALSHLEYFFPKSTVHYDRHGYGGPVPDGAERSQGVHREAQR